MIKSQLIETVARRKGISIKIAERVVDTMFQKMKDELVAGGRIEIRGFGSFSVKGYDGYMGRNPKTGEPVPVAPKRLPVFRVGKDLAARVDQGS